MMGRWSQSHHPAGAQLAASSVPHTPATGEECTHLVGGLKSHGGDTEQACKLKLSCEQCALLVRVSMLALQSVAAQWMYV